MPANDIARSQLFTEPEGVMKAVLALWPSGLPLVMVCIGTDRVTGDALGPLVGTNLERLGMPVYGTLAEPIHATNFKTDWHQKVQALSATHWVIGVDAEVGDASTIGKVRVWPGSVNAGMGTGALLPAFGGCWVTGVTGYGSPGSASGIWGARLFDVHCLADIIINALYNAFETRGRPTIPREA